MLPGVLTAELHLPRLQSVFSSSLSSPSLMMFVSPRGQISLLFLFFVPLTLSFKPRRSIFPFTDAAESPASPCHPRVPLHFSVGGFSPANRHQVKNKARAGGRRQRSSKKIPVIRWTKIRLERSFLLKMFENVG